jgi:hypothetical protein
MWKASESRTRATIALAAVVCIAVMMLTVGVSASATARAAPTPPQPSASGAAEVNSQFVQYGAGSHTYVVKPNGHDDTADIQAAFNACTSSVRTCTVQLEKGTYHTAQVTVNGFQGSFVGAGQGWTVIQALPNLPPPGAAYNTASTPFWAGTPGPSNPWPVLFTFVGGTFSVSGMTVTEPYTNPIASPGWYWDPDLPAGVTATDLYALIIVTGGQANAAFDHVTVIGAGGDLSSPLGTPSTFNLADGIVYEGMLLPTGWTSAWGDQIPLSGTFSLTHSLLNRSISAVWVQNLLNATVVVASNSIQSAVSQGFFDVSNSQLYFVGNSFTNIMYGAAVDGIQSFYKTDLLPSTVYVVGNSIAVNWEGSGAFFYDFGVPSTLSAVISGNTVESDNSCGCYTWEASASVGGESLNSLVVTGNRILGGGTGIEIAIGPGVAVGNTVIGADVGVGIYGGIGALVSGNLIKNSSTWGIAVQTVLGTPINNRIVGNWISNSGAYDLYWDGTGTGNVWIGNVYGTSSPPGL